MAARPQLARSAYFTGEAASSLSSLALRDAAMHTIDVRALRMVVHQVTPEDWTVDDLAPLAAETQYLLYVPSPRAVRLWVGVWYGAGRAPGTVAAGSRGEMDAWVAKLSSPATPESNTVQWRTDLESTPGGEARYPPIGQVPSSGINSGLEQFVSTTWGNDGPTATLDVTPLSGEAGWVGIRYLRLLPLTVALVEVVR